MGLVYAQVTKVHPSYGPLIRVIVGAHPLPRTDWARLVSEGTAAWYFTDPNVGTEQGLWRVVAKVAVPEQYRAYPTFRWALPNLAKGDDRDATDGGWWLWSGGQRTFVDRLSHEQQVFPVEALTFPRKIVADMGGPDREQEPTPDEAIDAFVIEHRLVFASESSASAATLALCSQGYDVVSAAEATDPTAVHVGWRGSLTPDQVVMLQREAEGVATRYGGTLDDSYVRIRDIKTGSAD